jgi:tetratricopeptide (TPR) repeat protein
VYDRKLADVFAIQDDIARRVVAALALVLSEASQSALQRQGRPSLTAYDLYLRGRALLRQPRTPAILEQATTLFEQALAADAGFTEARAGLCEAWLARYENARTAQAYRRGEEACQAAAQGPNSAEQQVALGQLRLQAGRLAEAEAAFTRARAIAYDPMDAILGLAGVAEARRKDDAAEAALAEARRLDPEDARTFRARGNLLFHRGRYAEAAREYADEIARSADNASAYAALGAAQYMDGDFQRAAEAWQTSLRLAPTRGGYSNSGTALYYLGHYAEAAEMYRKALALAPGDHQMWGNLGDALTQLGGSGSEAAAAYGKALALGQDRLRINSADALTLADLSLYQAALGHSAEARALLGKAMALEPETMYVRYDAALVRARLGEREAALDDLEKAVALGYQRRLIAGDAGLRSLRDHPRFAALVAARPP